MCVSVGVYRERRRARTARFVAITATLDAPTMGNSMATLAMMHGSARALLVLNDFLRSIAKLEVSRWLVLRTAPGG